MIRNTLNPTTLITAAITALSNSYAPYSHFNVAAAALMGSRKIYTGVNIENASYPAGMCAERNAVFHAAACGERKLIAIAVIGGLNGKITDFCPPCGICRQVMREFCDPREMQVILAKSAEEYKIFTLEQLLPESFGPHNLA